MFRSEDVSTPKPHPAQQTPPEGGFDSVDQEFGALGRAAARLLSNREARPAQIGPYKILQELGEGGMGIVYLAEQVRPVRRRVALKIIKLGMDTKQALARFESEREALARMDHPSVAKVFDAGSTDEGRPYFVMEYVPGIPITEYCDKHRLAIDERLRLFMEVCHAVQHAHQKGIIHRDIKPSNVLVAVCDEKPVPKVIDFGVAKATQQRLTERTLFTEHGQLIGTPGYMSPEQAEMSALDIDTRSDIYSLGVLLYELLVGRLPFETQTLLQAGFFEIQRIIREQEPARPSTKVGSLGEASVAVAQKRKTEVRTLVRSLRGDLDWIIMKCLEKDRTRRYDTANGLALEIERYFHNEPVRAGPPTVSYRVRKFVRRHRLACAMTSVLALGLIGFATIDLLQWNWAVKCTNMNGAVVSFTGTTLAAAASRLGSEATFREVFDEAVHDFESNSSSRPAERAVVHATIAEIYQFLDDKAQTEYHLRRAVHLLESDLTTPDDYIQLQWIRRDLALALGELGRFQEAQPLLSDAYQRFRFIGWIYSWVYAESMESERSQFIWVGSELASIALERGLPADARRFAEDVLHDCGDISEYFLDKAFAEAVLLDVDGHGDQVGPLFEQMLNEHGGVADHEDYDHMASMLWFLRRHGYAAEMERLGDKASALRLKLYPESAGKPAFWEKQ